jgi:predicted RNA-binding protein with EMAP domain
MNSGERISRKIEHVFVLLGAQRDEQATKLLQQVFDELNDIKYCFKSVSEMIKHVKELEQGNETIHKKHSKGLQQV